MFGLSNYNLIVSLVIIAYGITRYSVTELIIRAIIVFPALIAHEFAHGYASYKLGDSTAKSMGRLSLNPMKHLDPIGAACILSFGFGWAKPVMVNPYYYKKPKRDMALTALAGPVSNFILAFLGVAIFKLMVVTNVPYNSFSSIIVMFLNNFISINIGLGVFNLIPVPPLDGSKVFLPLLPHKLYMDIMQYEHLGWLILIFALATGVLDPVISTASTGLFHLFSLLVGGLR